jgi:hypothetical protein
MRIQRPRRLVRQEILARELRAELLRLIRRRTGRSQLIDTAAGWQQLLRLVELSAPGYSVRTRTSRAADVDRRTSMLTGPFYTSEAFPVPADSAGRPMFPILQLELDEASAAIQQPLGDGLLQLWHGTADSSTSIRVVPLRRAYEDVPTPFTWNPSPDVAMMPLPSQWNMDPEGNAVQEIVELVGTGFESQSEYILACYDDIGPEALGWLGTLLTLFGEKAPQRTRGREREVRLFGAFCPIQYSAADVGMPCLMSMGWGSSGGAQLFYELRKGLAPRFEFHSSQR